MAAVFTFSPDIERFKKSGLVAAGAMLHDVMLLKIAASRPPEETPQIGESACEMRIRHRMVESKLIDDTTLAVQIEGLLEFRQTEKPPNEQENIIGNIAVTYELRYQLPEGPFPEGVKESLSDFGEINGLFNAWPYLRAKMQEISLDMGIPVVLPTLRISPRKSEGKAKAVSAPAADIGSSPSDKKA
jgi:hypothetical protein